MGNLLDEPAKDKTIESGQIDQLRYTAMGMQGWRKSMEDAHITNTKDLGNGRSLFAVFDGHGGKEAAKYASVHYVEELMKLDSFKQGKYEDALIQVNYELDKLMRKDDSYVELFKYATESTEEPNKNDLNGTESGCTATVVLITPNKIYCANAGDSRTVMSEGGKAVPLSFDHKPDDDAETKRIESAGGYVENGRVDGNLAVSRALGDFELKNKDDLGPDQQKVSSKPDIKVVDITAKSDFIFLACDGIWDMKSNEEAIAWCHDKCYPGNSLAEARAKTDFSYMTKCLTELLDDCCAEEGNGKGTDNMSAIMIELRNPK